MSQDSQNKLQDPDYKGERTHPRLKDGPLEERGCTDCLCLLIFAAFWAGMVILAGYGFTKGHPEQLAAPFDSFGNQCGIGNYANYSFLYWYINDSSLEPTAANQTVCVQECPTGSDLSDFDLNCSPDLTSSCGTAYETTPLGGRLCIPGNLSLINGLSSGDYSVGFLQQVVSDLMTAKWIILLVAGIALLFGFFYMFLMRFCSGLVTWGLIIFYFVALGGFGLICYSEAQSTTIADPFWFQCLAYIAWAVGAISLVLFCCFYRKIELAIAVLKCSAEFIENVPTTLIIPPFFFIMSCIFYAYWLFSFVFIIGTNPVTASGGLPFPSVSWSPAADGIVGYYVFGLLWNHAFLAALPQFVIASACCLWYFAQGQNKEPKSPVSTSICRGLFYHFGSIALGSFIIAVLDAIRLVLTYFETHMRNARSGGAQNCCANYCLTCSNCCLDCFERFMKFINRHAYIQIAMTGEGFCKAAQESFYLMLRNAMRFAAVHGIGALFVFFGQLFITFVASIIGYEIITRSDYFINGLYSPFTPTLFFVLISLIIAHVFMSVYGVSADTIIHCFCMDEEMNSSAQNAPPMLREFIDKHVPQKLMS